MKAIVLSYEKYRRLTDHMIHMYAVLWPNNPFTFCTPYQKLSGKDGPDRKYILCPPDIKGTVLALLEGLDEQEWIYWCIDDKYPINLDVRAMQSVFHWIHDVNIPSVDSVLCCRPRKLMRQKRLTGKHLKTGNGITLLERKNYKCIWIHQFLRVKVLRHLFESFPDEISDAKAMDQMKDHIDKPDRHRLFVTEHTLTVFGESTSRGVITENCNYSMKKHGLPLPEWHDGVLARANFHGKMPGPGARLWSRLISAPLNRTS